MHTTKNHDEQKGQMMDKDQIYEILNQAYFSEQPAEKKVLRRLPKMLRSVKVFVDIGASLGQYTFHANQCLRRSYILAIEPDHIRFERLRDNCHRWELLSNNKLEPLHAAISDQDGKTKFYVTNSPVSGGLFQHGVPHTAGELRWEEVFVDCFRLDTLFKDTSPDLVKIDVEGSELRVLKGCARILKERRAKFLIELHNWSDPLGQKNANEVINLLNSFGYYSGKSYGICYFARRAPLEIPLLWSITQVQKLLILIALHILPMRIRRQLRSR